jgi:hypothetical protein
MFKSIELSKKIKPAFTNGKSKCKAGAGNTVNTYYLPVNTGSHEEMKPFYARLRYDDIRMLEGKILTIIDACIGDKNQNKAIKDLIRRSIWFDWNTNLDKVNPECSESMPPLDI